MPTKTAMQHVAKMSRKHFKLLRSHFKGIYKKINKGLDQKIIFITFGLNREVFHIIHPPSSTYS